MTKRKPFGKETILKRDEYKCQYCGADTTGIDHIIPYSYNQKNEADNMVACCSECNSLASNFIFRNFIEKKNYILDQRLKRSLNNVNPNLYPEFMDNKCLNCGDPFIKKRPWQKFCKTKCRMDYWREHHPHISPEELKKIKERLNIE